jgi:hypothetical protein
MDAFARRTGLIGGGEPRRYLWTDAFAVCTFLELHRRTGDERYKDLALRLVHQVHHTLGRHREDDPRTGWISGLDEEMAEQHPTRGGLRIGKDLPERKPDAPIDRRLEWERDGQYYHYLTKWMHALNRISRITGERTYNRWALELAETAHDRFTYARSSEIPKRMVWKMSIDLSYPLVEAMGQHDPLDGLITYQELQATAAEKPARPDLSREIEAMNRMCEGVHLVTDDALGIGGLLSDAYRLAQLVMNEDIEEIPLLRRLLDASVDSMRAYVSQAPLEQPIEFRLAFRELGLAIGLEAVERLHVLFQESAYSSHQLGPLRAMVEDLLQYEPVRRTIKTFWLDDARRETEAWAGHRDINAVMLATSLAPDGYLSV